MTVFIVSYPREEWVDVINLEFAAASIRDSKEVFTKILALHGVFLHRSAIAKFNVPDPLTLEVEWVDTAINTANGVETGKLTLSWVNSKEFMLEEPALARWDGADGHMCYATVTKIKNYHGVFE